MAHDLALEHQPLQNDCHICIGPSAFCRICLLVIYHGYPTRTMFPPIHFHRLNVCPFPHPHILSLCIECRTGAYGPSARIVYLAFARIDVLLLGFVHPSHPSRMFSLCAFNFVVLASVLSPLVFQLHPSLSQVGFRVVVVQSPCRLPSALLRSSSRCTSVLRPSPVSYALSVGSFMHMTRRDTSYLTSPTPSRNVPISFRFPFQHIPTFSPSSLLVVNTNKRTFPFSLYIILLVSTREGGAFLVCLGVFML
ncbi:hypothetical protein OF83DRAFT_1131503 [Amylostereum chailletii]|nr:hypothetical protein OF83DRAFT_1131503 [Amylostereum chailletii]